MDRWNLSPFLSLQVEIDYLYCFAIKMMIESIAFDSVDMRSWMEYLINDDEGMTKRSEGPNKIAINVHGYVQSTF